MTSYVAELNIKSQGCLKYNLWYSSHEGIIQFHIISFKALLISMVCITNSHRENFTREIAFFVCNYMICLFLCLTSNKFPAVVVDVSQYCFSSKVFKKKWKNKIKHVVFSVVNSEASNINNNIILIQMLKKKKKTMPCM